MAGLDKSLEEAWVDVLAHIFRSVDWKIVARRRSRYDVFEHRLEFAKYERGVPEVIQRLCNSLSVQAPSLPLDAVRLLRDNEERAMRVLRRMPKLLTLLAGERARQLG